MIKGEIIHQLTVAELSFLHLTHRLLLGNMCVCNCLSIPLDNIVTEWKNIFFLEIYNKRGDNSSTESRRVMVLAPDTPSTIGHVCVQLFEYPLWILSLMDNKVTEWKDIFFTKIDKN